MKTLIVSATKHEIETFMSNNNFIKNKEFENLFETDNFDVLIPGIGSAFTIFYLTNILNKKSYNKVLNIGIAGAFNRKFKLGELLIVKQDIFADLGIDNQGVFKTLSDEKISFQENLWKFTDGLINKSYKKVNAITVNTASGSETIINKWVQKYNPDIETMEGAGVYFVCNKFNIPAVQIRAISNYVEPRNKNNWNLPRALENINQCLSNNFINI